MEDLSEEYIRRLPKAELHVHVEGSVNPAMLLQLSRKYGTDLARLSEEELEALLFRYPDFYAFLETYKTVCSHLREAADYNLILDWLTSYFQHQNIRYAELIYAPAIAWVFQRDGRAILEFLLDWSEALRREKGILVRWILDCVRSLGPESARRTARLALEYADRGVVAVGMGGDERSIPLREFDHVFRWTIAHGLYLHLHAGEIGGPGQIWEAIRLGVNRIGHGIQAARDSRLIDYLREHALALDICLTSNAKTGAWSPLSDNPFRLLFKRGVPVTLNTDDPGLFQVTLSEELFKASTYFDLTREQIHRLILQGAHSSFLPYRERMDLMHDFHEKIREIEGEEFGLAK